MAQVSIRNVVKRFGAVAVVHGLSLDIAHNEFVVLVGPSGCGKSTMLRMIAGLEEVTSGEIWIGERKVNNVEPKDRNIAMVFQNYALYPHMTVAKNIAFGLRAAKLPRAEVDKRVQEVAATLGLAELLARRPAELSGGQRQRVAMGRAMVRSPQVFLFDEPLSNLDAKLRGQMRTEIKRLHQKVQTTMIYVTHDQVEAMTLADRIVIMRAGHIQQIGTPLELYHRPANMFVAGFIGSPAMNLLRGQLVRAEGAAAIKLAGGVAVPFRQASSGASHELGEGREVVLGLRPDDVTVSDGAPAGAGSWSVEATVSVVEPLGSQSLVFLDLAGAELLGTADGRAVPQVGSRVRLAVDLAHAHLFDAASEQRLG
jgi:multiple sugar transport system ATP-binding protein